MRKTRYSQVHYTNVVNAGMSTAPASALRSLGSPGRRAEVYLIVRAAERELEPVMYNMDNRDYSYGDRDIA